MSAMMRWVRGAADPAILIDFNQRVRAVNEAAMQLLGLRCQADGSYRQGAARRSLDNASGRGNTVHRSTAVAMVDTVAALGTERVLEQAELACYDLLSGCNEGGENVCSPDCPAIRHLRGGQPTALSPLYCTPKTGTPLQLSLSTVLVPQPDADYALLLLRPVTTEVSSTRHGQNSPRFNAAPVGIVTLGRWQVRHGGEPIPPDIWKRPGCLNILKRLIVEPTRTLAREVIAESLWPQAYADASLSRLKVLLSYLRQGLAAAMPALDPMAVVESRGELLRLNDELVQLDVDMFESGLRAAAQYERKGHIGDAIRSYKETLELYGGEFLPEEAYAEWAEPERTRLRTQAVYGYDRLAVLIAQTNDLATAISYWRKGLALEPWREVLHRSVMDGLNRLGYRAEAMMQYRVCCTILQTEFGVDPSNETTLLHRKIARGG